MYKKLASLESIVVNFCFYIVISFFGFSSYDIKNNLYHLRLDRQLFLCPQNRCLDYKVTQHNCSKGSVRIAFYSHPILKKFENLFKHLEITTNKRFTITSPSVSRVVPRVWKIIIAFRSFFKNAPKYCWFYKDPRFLMYRCIKQ